MKIRADYVSNSSSSSFMLVGCAFDGDEIASAWRKLHEDKEESVDVDEEGVDADEEEFDEYDMAERLADELGLTVNRGISDFYDLWCIGLGFDDMKDDETKSQFKARIDNALNKAFPDAHSQLLVDGGYDG